MPELSIQSATALDTRPWHCNVQTHTHCANLNQTLDNSCHSVHKARRSTTTTNILHCPCLITTSMLAAASVVGRCHVPMGFNMCSVAFFLPTSRAKTHNGMEQGSHYILILKFKDFSRTFKDPEVTFSRTNSRRKFTAWTVLQQYLISISVIMGQF